MPDLTDEERTRDAAEAKRLCTYWFGEQPHGLDHPFEAAIEGAISAARLTEKACADALATRVKKLNAALDAAIEVDKARKRVMEAAETRADAAEAALMNMTTAAKEFMELQIIHMLGPSGQTLAELKASGAKLREMFTTPHPQGGTADDK